MVYISNKVKNQIVVISETGLFIYNNVVRASIRSPEGLAFSGDGNLHVTGHYSNNYAVFSAAGKLLRSHEFCSATDVAVDAAGFVFAARYNNGSDSLSIFDPRGNVIHTIQLSSPWGVTVAPDDSIWVAGLGPDKLLKF